MSRRSSGTRVFVGGLSYRVRERDLEKFFQKIGRVMDISMKNGYAFVEFDDYRDADDAVYELNGKELMGERVSVEHARGPGYRRARFRPKYRTPPRSSRRDKDGDHRNNERYGPPTRTEYRLIVENLSSRVSWQDLKDYMRQAGEVTYADALDLAHVPAAATVPSRGLVAVEAHREAAPSHQFVLDPSPHLLAVQNHVLLARLKPNDLDHVRIRSLIINVPNVQNQNHLIKDREVYLEKGMVDRMGLETKMIKLEARTAFQFR